MKKTQNEGYFASVKGRPSDKHRGRPKASENISHIRGGGPHSYYVITGGLKELKKLMSSSDATRLIHDRLKKEGMIQEFYKFFLLAGFYAIREGGESKGKMFGILKASAPFYISQISANDFSLWDDYVNMLRSKDDNELDLLAERLACLMAEHNPFDYFIYFLRLLPTYLNINV